MTKLALLGLIMTLAALLALFILVIAITDRFAATRDINRRLPQMKQDMDLLIEPLTTSQYHNLTARRRGDSIDAEGLFLELKEGMDILNGNGPEMSSKFVIAWPAWESMNWIYDPKTDEVERIKLMSGQQFFATDHIKQNLVDVSGEVYTLWKLEQ